jgi:hypothetical protein
MDCTSTEGCHNLFLGLTKPKGGGNGAKRKQAGPQGCDQVSEEDGQEGREKSGEEGCQATTRRKKESREKDASFTDDRFVVACCPCHGTSRVLHAQAAGRAGFPYPAH